MTIHSKITKGTSKTIETTTSNQKKLSGEECCMHSNLSRDNFSFYISFLLLPNPRFNVISTFTNCEHFVLKLEINMENVLQIIL